MPLFVTFSTQLIRIIFGSTTFQLLLIFFRHIFFEVQSSSPYVILGHISGFANVIEVISNSIIFPDGIPLHGSFLCPSLPILAWMSPEELPVFGLMASGYLCVPYVMY